MTEHKCTLALIFQNKIFNCDEAVIYVPDLYPICETDPIINDWVRMSNIFYCDRCDDFVIKNPICGELLGHIQSNITWQIYKCNHPLLNLLLLNGYVQCGVMECEDYYFTGFFIGSGRYGERRNKITLITPKKKNIAYKPIHKIVKEFIITMQNVKNNFGITAIPCHKILCNDDVENFIDEQETWFIRNRDHDMIGKFKTVMQNKKNNCYFEYKKAYDEYKKNAPDEHKNIYDIWARLNTNFFFNDADIRIIQYINMKYNSKIQRERYNLNFDTAKVLI